MRVIVPHPYTKFEVRRPCRSEDVSALMGLVTLTFDLLTLKLVYEYIKGGKPSFKIWAR